MVDVTSGSAVGAQVCGDADVWGDGVVPNVSSHLDGAINLDLPDVVHRPFPAGMIRNDSSKKPWYGARDVVDQWIEVLNSVHSSNNKCSFK